jgi:cation diffusion facilitator CzcD-associated flavoprotein CzcO/acetyl esterase/lipase
MSSGNGSQAEPLDVVVVGAGFAGLYLLHRLRNLGFTAHAFDAADDVGGTWYWNRYPGARCDVQSLDYSYTFDSELEDSWRWSQKYAPQPEILRYLQHVADSHDLRRDITFSTRIESATWDDDASLWRLRTSASDEIAARHYVMATGCLSVPKEVDIAGTDRFGGDVYFTSRWPHEGVDFTGQRVAVIGTGSSAIQSIPLIAEQASQVTVFQRTPNFSIPAYNGPVPADKFETVHGDRAAYREAARWSGAGVPVPATEVSALMVTDEERQAHYEEAWRRGGIIEFLNCYSDHLTNAEANEHLSEFVRNKIRARVDDPATAELLCPRSFPIGTKRLCVDTNYYETYNLPHVRLIDLHATPITTITSAGVETSAESMEFDAIVFATGFDAMTGAMVNVDITGRDGVSLKDEWAGGPTTYLGLMVGGFPNLFMVTGPGSPSVLANMAVAIEQHVEWVSDCLERQRADGFDTIEPTDTAVDGWVEHVNRFADLTLMPLANSWYMGANVPGKPRVFLPYPGGVERYRGVCNTVAEADYLGFERRVGKRSVRSEAVVQPLQPDVMIMLELMATFNLPAMDTMSAVEARAFSDAMSAQRAPGPDVGEVVDGTFPGAAGPLCYRLYRPAGDGPHPIIAYYHGGGWVLGSANSDDPFCRDLCARTGSIVVSLDYRHAPEARFPAPVDDAYAGLQWLAGEAEALGGIPGQLFVAGWSAGANLAAVVCQLARDNDGPAISGQLLITPATDGAATSQSLVDNGASFVLTADLMTWFWDHYIDVADRTDPRASPLRAASLAGLPPAVVVTCEFDPLRDEGVAYAEAMRAAGVQVQHIAAAGHIHTSLHAVDVLPSGAPIRAKIADAMSALTQTSTYR